MLHIHSEKGVVAVVSSIEKPPNWILSQEKMIELVPVQSGTLEWDRIEELLHSTLPCTSCRGLLTLNEFKTNGFGISMLGQATEWRRKCWSSNEIELFHGTRTTSPEKIYGSEKGFDFRFSDRGLWGEGAYFAEEAKYSNEFAYKVPKSDATATESE